MTTQADDVIDAAVCYSGRCCQICFDREAKRSDLLRILRERDSDQYKYVFNGRVLEESIVDCSLEQMGFQAAQTNRLHAFRIIKQDRELVLKYQKEICHQSMVQDFIFQILRLMDFLIGQ